MKLRQKVIFLAITPLILATEIKPRLAAMAKETP